MEDTKTLVTRFREKTLDILNCFSDEDFDKISKLLEERKSIIQTFKENPEFYAKEEITEEFKKTNIMEMDAKIKELTVKNMKAIKEKLEEINTDKFIRKKYYTGFSGNSLFFDKKVY